MTFVPLRLGHKRSLVLLRPAVLLPVLTETKGTQALPYKEAQMQIRRKGRLIDQTEIVVIVSTANTYATTAQLRQW